MASLDFWVVTILRGASMVAGGIVLLFLLVAGCSYLLMWTLRAMRLWRAALHLAIAYQNWRSTEHLAEWKQKRAEGYRFTIAFEKPEVRRG